MGIEVASQHAAEWSQSRDEIIKALFKFQNKRKALPRTKTARIRTRNDGEYTYKYSDLDDLLSAAVPLLEECGLYLDQSTEASAINPEKQIMLVTEVYHVESGQYKRTYHPIPLDEVDPKRTGAWESYIRRYHAIIALGYATEDPDGDIEAMAIAEMTKTKNHMIPLIHDSLRLHKGAKTDQVRANVEDKLLAEVDKLSEWQYGVIWKDMTTQQKNQIREILTNARIRRGDPKAGERTPDERQDARKAENV